MTQSQMLRYKRRMARAAQERRERTEVAFGIIFILITLAMFGIAGAVDYQNEVSELALWASRGVTIARW